MDQVSQSDDQPQALRVMLPPASRHDVPGQFAIGQLIEALQSDDPQICISAAAVLGLLEDERAINALVEVTEDETQYEVVREVAARSLRQVAYRLLFDESVETIPPKPDPRKVMLPGWLVTELTQKSIARSLTPPPWIAAIDEEDMLYVPDVDDEQPSSAPNRIPVWLRTTDEEYVSLAVTASELPDWLG